MFSVIFFIELIILILLIYIFQDAIKFSQYSQEHLLLVLALIIVSSIVFWSKKDSPYLRQNKFKPSVFFLIGFIIVFFQMPVDYLLYPQNRFYFDTYFISSNLVNISVNYAAICLVCIYLGYLIRFRLYRTRLRNQSTINRSVTFINPKILLGIATLLFLIYFNSIDRDYFRGGYGRYMNVEGIPTLFYIAQQYFMYTIVIYIIQISSLYNKRITFYKYLKSFSLYFYILVLIWTMLVFMSGDRGPVLQIGLVFLSCYIFSNGIIISKKQLLLFVLAGGLSLTFLGILRSLDSDLSASEISESVFERISTGSLTYSLSPLTAELSHSIETFCVALSLKFQGFSTYGLISIYNFATIIPGSSFLLAPLGLNEPEYFNLATDFLGYDHSAGVSFLDAILFDFGLLISPIIVIIWGYILRYIDELTFQWKSISIFNKCFLTLFMWKSLYFARSDYFMLFRDVVVVYIVYKIFLFFFKQKEHELI